jgi:hypothetical protein
MRINTVNPLDVVGFAPLHERFLPFIPYNKESSEKFLHRDLRLPDECA